VNWMKYGYDEFPSPAYPCPRASSSAAVYQQKMYIFGGQDDENNKLCDLWEFDINQRTWRQITDFPADSYQPGPRSGHSASIYNGKMYIFGGILELTKELNELLAFDFAKGSWELCCKDSGTYGDEGEEHFSHTRAGEESPGVKHSNTYNLNSPTKARKSIYPQMSPSKKSAIKPKNLKVQTVNKQENVRDQKHVSPTSMQMQNTFIIQNADESFDAYWALMRKKKGGGHNTHMANQEHSATMGHNSSPGNDREATHFGFVEGIQPTARDGHTAEISDKGCMFVFGGDRHHMPFNDLYMMKL